MKKVMVYAYTNLNFGDDLFIKILLERYPDVEFKLYTYPCYKEVFAEHGNLRVCSNANIIAKLTNFVGSIFCRKNLYENILAMLCDACVYIGGSLFIQGANWREHLRYISGRRVANKPFFLLGANFGPYTESDFYSEHNNLFASYTDVCFRDRYSYELFCNLANVRLCPDIVFSYEPRLLGIVKKQVSISVLGLVDKPNIAKFTKDYHRKIAELCVAFVEAGYSVNLVSFCQAEGDELAVEQVYALLDVGCAKSVSRVFYRGDIKQIIALFAESTAIIATRFHSMILGWILEKPVYPILYSQKMKNVIDDINIQASYVAIEDIARLQVCELVRWLETTCAININKQKLESGGAFVKLDECLK